MRLKQVTFLCRTEQQLGAVLSAFSCVYSTLKTLTPEQLTRHLDSDMAAEQEIAFALAGSRGTVKRIEVQTVGGANVSELHVIPGVGDRYLIVRKHKDGWLATCDYSRRPSEEAAVGVIKLVEELRYRAEKQDKEATALPTLYGRVREMAPGTGVKAPRTGGQRAKA